MSRRCKTSAAALLAAGLVGAALAAPTVAVAGPAPLVMGPLYAEPERKADDPAPPSAEGCPVHILELTDARRGPETVGSVLTLRSINAPSDREAWLRSVFEVGLAARGFKPTFIDAGAVAPEDAVTARIRVRAVWISLLQMNKSGTFVIQASTAAPGATDSPLKVYRGDKTSVNMWGSAAEFNGLLNDVFAEALDALAEDLRPLCASTTTTVAST